MPVPGGSVWHSFRLASACHYPVAADENLSAVKRMGGGGSVSCRRFYKVCRLRGGMSEGHGSI